MSDAAKYREDMKAKARRMCEASSEKVDASDLPADYAFEGGKQSQPIRPKPRAYAHGGCVEGSKSKHSGMSVRVGNKSDANYLGGTRPTGGRVAQARRQGRQGQDQYQHHHRDRRRQSTESAASAARQHADPAARNVLASPSAGRWSPYAASRRFAAGRWHDAAQERRTHQDDRWRGQW